MIGSFVQDGLLEIQYQLFMAHILPYALQKCLYML